MSPSTKPAEIKLQFEAYRKGSKALMHLLRRGRSWSGYERNCAFLNCRGDRFANVSGASGLDFTDDGRGLAMVDWDHDGDLDLWTRNRTAPRLRLMRNNTDPATSGRSFLALRLVGVTCNRDAIGSRVEVHLSNSNEPPLIQTLYAGDAFLSQSSKWLHFGLGTDPNIDHVTVHWPESGQRSETFRGLEAGRRYRLVQGTSRAEPLPVGRKQLKLTAVPQPLAKVSSNTRTILPARLPLPNLAFESLNGEAASIASTRPLLVNFWASWCPPCVNELKEFAAHEAEIRRAGLDILALSLDGLDTSNHTGPEDAQQLLEKIRFPFDVGRATPGLLEKIEMIEEIVFNRIPPFNIPVSYLLDGHGQIAAIYRGPVNLDVLIKDLSHLEANARQLLDLATPMSGRWLTSPAFIDVSIAALAARSFLEHEYFDDVSRFIDLARARHDMYHNDARLSDDVSSQLSFGVADLYLKFAIALKERGEVDRAITALEEGIQLNPEDPFLYNNLGNIWAQQGRYEDALRHYRLALDLIPDSADTLYNIGNIYSIWGETDTAIEHYELALRIDPQRADVHVNLGNAFKTNNKIIEAIEQYQEALRTRPTLPEAHYNLATAWLQLGESEDALVHYNQALRAQPDYARAHIGLGRLLRREGRREEAIQRFRHALELQPQLPTAHFYFARSMRERGELTLALDHFEQAVSLAEAWSLAHSELATTLQLLGRDREAIQHYRTALRLESHLINTAKRLAWLLSTHSEESLRDGVEAVRLATEVCQAVDYAHAGAVATLAAANAEQGQFDQAIANIQKAITLAQENQNPAEVTQYRKMLQHYQEGRPWRYRLGKKSDKSS